MPVRFSCEQCGQRLSVKDEKAGMPVRCPKCRARQIVPQPETAAVSGAAEAAKGQSAAAPAAPPPPPGEAGSTPVAAQAGPPPVAEGEAPPVAGGEAAGEPVSEGQGSTLDLSSLGGMEPGEEEGDMFAEFAVYDEPAEWVYEEDTEEPSARMAGPNKHYVAVSRPVLYVQGGLLAALAIFGFLFGFVAGRLSVDPNEANTSAARPAQISCLVLVRNGEGTEMEEAGAVVLVVPADAPFEEKLTAVGMSPSDPVLPADSDIHSRLKVLGGALGRTGEDGRCTLRVPRQGSYYFLCISPHGTPQGGAKPEDVAILGNYILGAYDLVNGKAYELRQRNVMGNTSINFRFE